MRERYVTFAVVAAVVGLVSICWGVLQPEGAPIPAMVAGSIFAPLSVLLFVAARSDTRPVWAAVVGAVVIGIPVALLLSGLVFVVAGMVLEPLLAPFVDILDRFRIDPDVVEVVSSSWLVVMAIHLVIVAPVTEEFGKALGARIGGLLDRRHAFLVGVAAGAGFAMVENVLYALFAELLGGGWAATSVARITGAAVHPLASGLVMLGWWEWQRHGMGRRPLRLFLAGVGVHALWNGSIVVLAVVAAAFDITLTAGFTLVSLSYSGAIGVAAILVLAWLTAAVSDGRARLLPSPDLTDARVVAAAFVVAASILVPVAALTAAIPSFFGS